MSLEPQCPCNGCDERTPECHPICMRYFVWKLEHDEWAEECKKRRNKYSDVDNFRIKQFDKVRKERRR